MAVKRKKRKSARHKRKQVLRSIRANQGDQVIVILGKGKASKKHRKAYKARGNMDIIYA